MTEPPSDDAAKRWIERAFEDAPALISVHRGKDHHFVFANRLFRASSDGRPLTGRPYAEAFPEFVEQGYLAIFDRVHTTGEPFVANGARADTPRTPGGQPEERYWNLTFQPSRDATGTVDGLTTFAFEVTEHVRSRRVAEEAEKRYDELLLALHVVVWRVNPTGWRLEWVRGDVAALLGVAPDDALAPGGDTQRVHPDDLAALFDARAAVRRPGDRYHVEYRNGDATGWRWIAEDGQLREQPGSDRLSVWGLVQDVTERVANQAYREQVHAELLRVQKLESLSLLAGGIAHDFNNLLTAILGNASLAELQLERTHPASGSIASMVSAAKRASDLTAQLLSFSGRRRLTVEPVDVNGQLVELVGLLHASISRKVTLRLDAGRVRVVDADRSQLNQVLMNLVINAAQAHGDEAGAVKIRTGVQALGPADLKACPGFPDATPGEFVVVEVSDTGCGMDAATAAKIFEPFFTTKPEGRGLGLAAVQGIVRGHRGLVRVQSAPGVGTTFFVYLPAAASGIAPAPPSPAPLAAQGTILVVDDEPAVRAFMRAALEFGGFKVLEAEDGEAGVATFAVHADTIDLVLLDLTMPRLGGEEALVQINALRPNTPVVMTSGFNELGQTRRLIGHGAVEFIQKPYPVRDLLELAGRLVRRS